MSKFVNLDRTNFSKKTNFVQSDTINESCDIHFPFQEYTCPSVKYSLKAVCVLLNLISEFSSTQIFLLILRVISRMSTLNAAKRDSLKLTSCLLHAGDNRGDRVSFLGTFV